MTTTSSSTDGSKRANRSDSDTAAEPAAAAVALPSAELLEFLGEFSDESGEWIDPLELDDAELPPDEAEGDAGHD